MVLPYLICCISGCVKWYGTRKPPPGASDYTRRMVQCFCAFAAAFALPPACTEVEKPSFAEPWALA